MGFIFWQRSFLEQMKIQRTKCRILAEIQRLTGGWEKAEKDLSCSYMSMYVYQDTFTVLGCWLSYF